MTARFTSSLAEHLYYSRSPNESVGFDHGPGWAARYDVEGVSYVLICETSDLIMIQKLSAGSESLEWAEIHERFDLSAPDLDPMDYVIEYEEDLGGYFCNYFNHKFQTLEEVFEEIKNRMRTHGFDHDVWFSDVYGNMFLLDFFDPKV